MPPFGRKTKNPKGPKTQKLDMYGLPIQSKMSRLATAVKNTAKSLSKSPIKVTANPKGWWKTPTIGLRQEFTEMSLPKKTLKVLVEPVRAYGSYVGLYAKRPFTGAYSAYQRRFTNEGREKTRQEKATGINFQHFEKRLSEIEEKKNRYDTMINYHKNKESNLSLSEADRQKETKKVKALQAELNNVKKSAAAETTRLENKLQQALMVRIEKNKKKTTKSTLNENANANLKLKGQNEIQTKNLEDVLAASSMNLGEKLAALKASYQPIQGRKEKENLEPVLDKTPKSTPTPTPVTVVSSSSEVPAIDTSSSNPAITVDTSHT